MASLPSFFFFFCSEKSAVTEMTEETVKVNLGQISINKYDLFNIILQYKYYNKNTTAVIYSINTSAAIYM